MINRIKPIRRYLPMSVLVVIGLGDLFREKLKMPGADQVSAF